nr:MAG TPA: hypothetical protein [Caudoviricetes sp.]
MRVQGLFCVSTRRAGARPVRITMIHALYNHERLMIRFRLSYC